jgi:hypothetical protein
MHEDQTDAPIAASTAARNSAVDKVDRNDPAYARQSIQGSVHAERNTQVGQTVANAGGTFVDAVSMKERVREKLSKPKYQVTDLYWETGCFQKIAKSTIFDKATLAVIAFNAIWIAYDTDNNGAATLNDAAYEFIVAENFFCAFFSFEWIIRFGSFRHKCDTRKDAWFVFDSFMVSMMVMETWVFTLLIVVMGSSGEGGGNVGLLRMARLLRLSRMARMGKLLRVMPELMIMLKGMAAAMKPVMWTLVLLLGILYIFGICFVQLGDGTEVGKAHFATVPQAMYTLMIHGVFLDSVGKLTLKLFESWILAVVFFVFILLGAMMVMNMLIGVLCQVVSAVSATEQEEMLVNHVNDKISMVMALIDEDGNGGISKDEFDLIMDNSQALRCLNDVGVDVFALIDLADYIFTDENNEDIEIDFSRFMQIVLQLRGSNQATVKDIVDLRKFLRVALYENQMQTRGILNLMTNNVEAAKSSTIIKGAPEVLDAVLDVEAKNSVIDPRFSQTSRKESVDGQSNGLFEESTGLPSQSNGLFEESTGLQSHDPMEQWREDLASNSQTSALEAIQQSHDKRSVWSEKVAHEFAKDIDTEQILNESWVPPPYSGRRDSEWSLPSDADVVDDLAWQLPITTSHHNGAHASDLWSVTNRRQKACPPPPLGVVSQKPVALFGLDERASDLPSTMPQAPKNGHKQQPVPPRPKAKAHGSTKAKKQQKDEPR